jgi:hypothetical protein
MARTMTKRITARPISNDHAAGPRRRYADLHRTPLRSKERTGNSTCQRWRRFNGCLARSSCLVVGSRFDGLP